MHLTAVAQGACVDVLPVGVEFVPQQRTELELEHAQAHDAMPAEEFAQLLNSLSSISSQLCSTARQLQNLTQTDEVEHSVCLTGKGEAAAASEALGSSYAQHIHHRSPEQHGQSLQNLARRLHAMASCLQAIKLQESQRTLQG